MFASPLAGPGSPQGGGQDDQEWVRWLGWYNDVDHSTSKRVSRRNARRINVTASQRMGCRSRVDLPWLV